MNLCIASAGSANQCILGDMYLRSNLPCIARTDLRTDVLSRRCAWDTRHYVEMLTMMTICFVKLMPEHPFTSTGLRFVQTVRINNKRICYLLF